MEIPRDWSVTRSTAPGAIARGAGRWRPFCGCQRHASNAIGSTTAQRWPGVQQGEGGQDTADRGAFGHTGALCAVPRTAPGCAAAWPTGCRAPARGTPQARLSRCGKPWPAGPRGQAPREGNGSQARTCAGSLRADRSAAWAARTRPTGVAQGDRARRGTSGVGRVTEHDADQAAFGRVGRPRAKSRTVTTTGVRRSASHSSCRSRARSRLPSGGRGFGRCARRGVSVPLEVWRLGRLASAFRGVRTALQRHVGDGVSRRRRAAGAVNPCWQRAATCSRPGLGATRRGGGKPRGRNEIDRVAAIDRGEVLLPGVDEAGNVG